MGEGLRRAKAAALATQKPERLTAVAIQRGGKIWGHMATFKSHYQLRQTINADQNGDRRERGDIEGFMTSLGRFVTRRAAVAVAIDAKQISEMWGEDGGRDLLSSDIDW